jgi:putative GTP pyrophosphokinase
MTKKFKDEYKSIQPSLNKALSELKRLIKTQLRKIDNPRLVRIRLTEGRIKTIESLLSKAKKNKWKQKDILKKARDIIGVRIVCANIEDIRRIRELLISNPRLNDLPQSEEDRILAPTPSGYRDFKFYVSYETGDDKCPNITCEIQIRTMLQDSWATLAHKDIYKEGTELPNSLKKLSFRLFRTSPCR